MEREKEKYRYVRKDSLDKLLRDTYRVYHSISKQIELVLFKDSYSSLISVYKDKSALKEIENIFYHDYEINNNLDISDITILFPSLTWRKLEGIWVRDLELFYKSHQVIKPEIHLDYLYKEHIVKWINILDKTLFNEYNLATYQDRKLVIIQNNTEAIHIWIDLITFDLRSFNWQEVKELIQWKKRNNIVKPMNKTVLVFLGPTSIGKTEFIKSLYKGQILLVKERNQITEFNPSIHKAIAYDDNEDTRLFKDRELFLTMLDPRNVEGPKVRILYKLYSLKPGLDTILISNRTVDDLLPQPATKDLMNYDERSALLAGLQLLEKQKNLNKADMLRLNQSKSKLKANLDIALSNLSRKIDPAILRRTTIVKKDALLFHSSAPNKLKIELTKTDRIKLVALDKKNKKTKENFFENL